MLRIKASNGTREVSVAANRWENTFTIGVRIPPQNSTSEVTMSLTAEITTDEARNFAYSILEAVDG
jgi:hypothetical protein